MIYLFITIVYLAAIGVLGCFVYSVKISRKTPLEKTIQKVMIFSCLAVFSNTIATLSNIKLLSMLLFGAYNFFIDIMLLCLLKYATIYTNNLTKLMRTQKVLNYAAALDLVLVMTNPITGIVFEVNKMYFPRSDILIYAMDGSYLYPVHIVITYLCVLLTFMIFIRRMITSPNIYKTKYAIILSAFCIGVAGHIVYLNTYMKVDLSLIFYSLFSFTVFYFSLIYVPKGLMDKLLYFTVNNMKDGIICMDIDNKCIHANQPAKTFCQANDDISVIENKIAEWKKDEVPVGQSFFRWRTIAETDGMKRYFKVEYTSIYDKKMNYIGCFFVIHDYTEEYDKYNEERYRATHDSLTGIYNKERFHEQVRRLLNENKDTAYYMICTDIKNFKIINDVFGASTGDRILRKIAKGISGYERDKSICGRISGDRFAICLPESDFDEEKFKLIFSDFEKIISNTNFKLQIHIGIYSIDERNLPISIMCDRANLAIRTIKDSYEDIFAYYKNDIREDYMNQQKVISEFETAISERQFKAYIQPQVFAESGFIRGGEALVRWLHPAEGLIPPYKFIPILENTGLISRLDNYMWRTACEQLRKWHDEGNSESYISVNISQKDFYLMNVYEVIIGLVEEYGIEPKNLHLEITETAVMSNPHDQLPLIQKLREYGFIIEIDDFGSGYSSLNTLKDMVADVLKVDMGFLRKTENEERSKIILKTIISLAKSLDMEVITEGVETKEQIEYLSKYGCDIYQGYYFAKPMPIADFEADYLNLKANEIK